MEFRNPDGTYFVHGAVIDAFEDGRNPEVAYFIVHNAALDDDWFFRAPGQLFDTRAFKRHLEHFALPAGARAQVFTRLEDYRFHLLNRLGQFKESFPAKIVKGLAFSPLTDIRAFVHNYLLDENLVDVKTLQAQLETLRHFEESGGRRARADRGARSDRRTGRRTRSQPPAAHHQRLHSPPGAGRAHVARLERPSACNWMKRASQLNRAEHDSAKTLAEQTQARQRRAAGCANGAADRYETRSANKSCAKRSPRSTAELTRSAPAGSAVSPQLLAREVDDARRLCEHAATADQPVHRRAVIADSARSSRAPIFKRFSATAATLGQEYAHQEALLNEQARTAADEAAQLDR